MKFKQKFCVAGKSLLAGLFFGLMSAAAWGQDDDIESGFKRLGPDEEIRLRGVVAAPVGASSLSSAGVAGASDDVAGGVG